jgi:hypothetical protein
VLEAWGALRNGLGDTDQFRDSLCAVLLSGNSM